MALKRKITKAEFDALHATIAAEYKADGPDFVLDAEGFDDAGELKRALDREREEAKTAKAKAKDLETKLATITDVDARRAGDVATLEKSWQGKIDAKEAEFNLKLAAKDKHLKATLVDSVATALAAELCGDNAALLLPHVTGRLVADLSGDKPLTRVVDKDGQPSAHSVEDLKKELRGNKQFAPIIIASKASGGGAAGGRQPVNGGAGGGDKKFKDLNDAERTEWHKRDPEGFQAAAVADRRVF